MRHAPKKSKIVLAINIFACLAGAVMLYGAYAWYDRYQIQNAEFETWVFNISDEDVGTVQSTQYDGSVHIASGLSHINGLGGSNNDYTSKRDIRLEWHFITTENGHNLLLNTPYKDITCYLARVTLPERKRNEIILMIGVYNKDTLRIRWSKQEHLPIDIDSGKINTEDAPKSGGIPLPKNWWKKINKKNQWPQMPEWNEAIDGPRYDNQSNGSWITVKADTIKKCEP